MEENASRFSLVYSLPIFEQGAIEKISRIGLTLEVQGLINKNIPITIYNTEINVFLPLLYQPYPKLITAYIDLER
jgi:hypothetical protein